jgi:hypothetical protein
MYVVVQYVNCRKNIFVKKPTLFAALAVVREERKAGSVMPVFFVVD